MMIEIGRILKENRKKLNLSQQTVADQLNIDRSTYACYEIGKTHPPLDTLVRLSHIFHLSIEELLGVQHEQPLIVAESAPDYDPAVVTDQEQALLRKLRSLNAASLQKVQDYIDRCLAEQK